jgi:hypothetical protein
VKSEKDLDKMLKTHPTIASLPKDESGRSELASMAPKSKRFVYVMMDSGASIHAGDFEELVKHFPGLILKVSKGQKTGEYALTADGTKIFNKGEFTLEGEINGVPLSIKFTNMKVKVPVASVRLFVRAGCSVSFYEGGGRITNDKNGATIDFIELGGVYFLKLRVDRKNSQGFPRPAA